MKRSGKGSDGNTFASSIESAGGTSAFAVHRPTSRRHRRQPECPSGRLRKGMAEAGQTPYLRLHLDGVRIHRSHDLDRVDICHRSRFAVTTPIRTVIDLAAVIADPLLGRI